MGLFNRVRSVFNRGRRFLSGKLNSAFNNPNKQKLGSFSRDIQELRDQPFRKIAGGGAPFEREGENLLIAQTPGGKGISPRAGSDVARRTARINEGVGSGALPKPSAGSLDRRPWDVIRAERIKEAEAITKFGEDLLRSVEHTAHPESIVKAVPAPVTSTKIGQTHTDSGGLINAAINSKTVKIIDGALEEAAIKTFGVTSNAKKIVAGFLGLMGTYGLGEWARLDNAGTSLSMALDKATASGNEEAIALADAETERLLNPSFITNVSRILPTNMISGFYEGIRALITKHKVWKMIRQDELDNRAAIARGEAPLDPIAKRQQDQIEMKAAADEKENEDIAKRQVHDQEMQRITDALKTEGIKESDRLRYEQDMELLILQQEFTTANAAERDRQMLEDHQLQMAYLQAKIEAANRNIEAENRNTPSHLNFGLL